MSPSAFNQLLESLDADTNRRGKQFEKIVKWWAQNDPIHSRAIKKVWLWDEWPDRPGRDIGIDLVAEMIDGSLCAIQAKCHDPERDIPKSEIDSFLAAATTRKFNHRWLVASTDGLSTNARRALADNHVTQILYSYLDSLGDFWPASLSGITKPAEIKKATPRPHQLEAIKDVVEGLQKASRGQLVMACGTGKTLTALWITEALKPKTTLVLVPSLSLLSQTLSEWAKNTNTKWNYLCVCSDETVNKSDDAPISTTDELPFDVTTKPADIANFLNQRGHKIIFSTYQSSAQVAKATKTTGTKFDLMICDEAHRLTGINDADFSTALDDEKIPAKKRLFMTATPRTYTPNVKARAAERGVEMNSMDDASVFGEVIHRLSFGEAVKDGLLTDYRVLIVGVTDSDAAKLIENQELVQDTNGVTTNARTYANHIGLAKTISEHQLSSVISFHGRVSKASDFATCFPGIYSQVGGSGKTVSAFLVSGKMGTAERRRLLSRLGASSSISPVLATNARCLTEGVDIPKLDAIAFIEPRSSHLEIVQAVGRVMRNSPGKTVGTIVVPIYISGITESEIPFADASYSNIWNTIVALKAHDSHLDLQLSEMRTALGAGGSKIELPKKIVLDIPMSIQQLMPNFVEKLTTTIIEETSSSWDYWYGRLNQNRSSRIPRGSIDASKRHLQKWMTKQRTAYRKGSLSTDKVSKLERLHFWTWNPYEDDWEVNFKLFLNFVEETGSPNPAPTRVWNGQQVGPWLHVQRQRYKRGVLEADRANRLKSVPGLVLDPSLQLLEDFLLHCQQYFDEHGHLKVPQSYVCRDGYPLGKRIAKRRWDIKKGSLDRKTAARIQELQGWTLNVRNSSKTTNAWLKVLNKWGLPDAFDHLSPQRRDRLYGWISERRKQFKKGDLPTSLTDQLESVDGWSWSGPIRTKLVPKENSKQ